MAASVFNQDGDSSPAVRGETVAPPSSNALNRSIKHLDVVVWLEAIMVSAAIRTFLTHPFTVAVARKRIHRDFISLPDVLRQTYAEGGGALAAGMRCLYRGFGFTLIGNVLGEALYLTTLENVRHHWPSSHGTVRDAIGGVAGDAVSIAACTPLSVIVNRQMTAGFGMTSGNVYESGTDVVRRLAKTDRGLVRSLYAGVSASIMMVPASGVFWASYGAVKALAYKAAEPALTRINAENPTSSSGAGIWSTTDNPLLNGISGVTASVVTSAVTNPFMVVRTRMQVVNDEAPSKATPSASSSGASRSRMVRVAKDLVRHEGYRGFYKGFRVNAAIAAADGLVFSSVYELTKYLADTTIN